MLYARELLGCLDGEARTNLWLLCATSLRRGGSLHLEFLARRPGLDDLTCDGLVRRLDPASVAAEIARAGGRVVRTETGPGTDFHDRPDPAVARLEARWERSTPSSRQETTTVSAGTRTLAELPAWIRGLRRSVEENRRLNRRIAELTDVVAELLVPLADRDEERARELLRHYRETTLAP